MASQLLSQMAKTPQGISPPRSKLFHRIKPGDIDPRSTSVGYELNKIMKITIQVWLAGYKLYFQGLLPSWKQRYLSG